MCNYNMRVFHLFKAYNMVDMTQGSQILRGSATVVGYTVCTVYG